MSRIEETLEIAEELYEYAILNKNDFVKDKVKYIMRNLAVVAEFNNSNIDDSPSEDYTNEIAKVKRKVPKWMKKTHQYNYKILKSYMDLSDCNKIKIRVDDIQSDTEIEAKIFLGHYNGMKTISEKNHGKVFEEVDKMVKLWEPVAEFIENQFNKNRDDYIDVKNNVDIIEIRIGEFVKEHINNILDLCEKNSSELESLQNIPYSRNDVGLGVNYSFLGLADNVEHGRYWTDTYIINNSEYRICSQWGGSLIDETGATRSKREGKNFKEYLIKKNILLDRYKNKKINFIVG